MAKTPRKGAVVGHKSSASHKSNPRYYPSARPAGKNFKAYNFKQKRNRRLSIAESTSSDSSDGFAGKGHQASARALSDSDSESSLTAMSEEDENAASRKGSVFFNGAQEVFNSKNSGPANASRDSSKGKKSTRSGKSAKYVRKRFSGKSKFYNAESQSEHSMEDQDEDEDEDDHVLANDSDGDEDQPEDEDELGVGALYSMMGAAHKYITSDSSDSNDDDQQENDSDLSSSDDSDIDFVQLQAERRKNNIKSGNVSNPEKHHTHDTNNNQAVKTRKLKTTSFRRRSDVAIPEDVKFKLEGESSIPENAVEDDSDSQVQLSAKVTLQPEEEDLGEEVTLEDYHVPFGFRFEQPLIEVPKINEEELNSDDDYEFDDNDLLATLHAENDFDEFITPPKEDAIKVRHGSLSSLNDDEFEESFLKEEEKYLVNEFETNGFDDEDVDQGRLETANAMKSFNGMGHAASQNEHQYATSSNNTGESDVDDYNEDVEYDVDDDEVDDYVDLIDFDEPIFNESSAVDSEFKEISSAKPTKNVQKLKSSHFPKRRIKKRGPLDSEEEDDSYLWNYFFSSDADSSTEEDRDDYDPNEELVIEEVFGKNLEERKRQLERESSMEPIDSEHDPGYDSSESTDVDLSLPPANSHNGLGSKSAKEVLSSKTADYRPPVLGTWAAIDSTPFGIIDGLSTRTLNNHTNIKNPRTKNWRGINMKNNSDDSAIELEELLNVSELDNDDENDVRIWRDFNNNKKHIPLGAFRNKTNMALPLIVTEHMSGYNSSRTNANYNRKRRRSNSQVKAKLASQSSKGFEPHMGSTSLSKELNLPSKSKRRNASIVDAMSEGYRTTKSGLFSENVLAGVEELLGGDRDFMALVTGL